MTDQIQIDMDQVVYISELRGIYDGWSIAYLRDGTRLNRWANAANDGPSVGNERRWAATDAYLRGEPSNGRWF